MKKTVIAGSFIFLFTFGVHAASNQVSVTEDGTYRYIKSNGIPDHNTGQFPNKRNPNSISSQNHNFRIPIKPVKSSGLKQVGKNFFGVALNGVPFDPETAEYWNNDRSSGWNYEALSGKMDLGLDNNNAHVQPNGTYHYHGRPISYLRSGRGGHSVLIGYAADGFPIYDEYGYVNPDNANLGVTRLKSSYRIKKGMRPSGPGGIYDGTYIQDYEYVEGLGNLDECNGREGVTPDFPDGTYAYFLTSGFPFIPRCHKGNSDGSFAKKRGGAVGQNMRGGQRGVQQGSTQQPPREAMAACSGKKEGASCSVQTPHGNKSGTCRNTPGGVACVPKDHRR